jgi:hypothetical protein
MNDNVFKHIVEKRVAGKYAPIIRSLFGRKGISDVTGVLNCNKIVSNLRRKEVNKNQNCLSET